MKIPFSLLMTGMCCLSAVALPTKYRGPGPVQCPMDYTLQKMTPAEHIDSLFDHDPKVIALAETYQHRLFDNPEGRDILRRSKEFSEHYVRYVHATAHGVRGVGDPKAKMLDFTPAQSGPNKKLETDIDELLDRRLNQLNTSGIPEKYFRTFKIEITPAGEAYVKPYKLRRNLITLNE